MSSRTACIAGITPDNDCGDELKCCRCWGLSRSIYRESTTVFKPLGLFTRLRINAVLGLAVLFFPAGLNLNDSPSRTTLRQTIPPFTPSDFQELDESIDYHCDMITSASLKFDGRRKTKHSKFFTGITLTEDNAVVPLIPKYNTNRCHKLSAMCPVSSNFFTYLNDILSVMHRKT